MSYTKPSVLVYEELQNSGGVASTTPDLGAVIVGPLFNVVRVDPTSQSSLASTLSATMLNISQLTTHVTDGGSPIAQAIKLTNKYPGQEVVPSSVTVAATSALVNTTSFIYSDGNSTDVAVIGGWFNANHRSRFVFGYDEGITDPFIVNKGATNQYTYRNGTDAGGSGGSPTATIGSVGDYYFNTGTGVTYQLVQYTSSFTASISGTVMTVTGAITGSPIAVEMNISGTGVTVGTEIVSLGSGTGGDGTYNIDNSQTVSSTTITAISDPIYVAVTTISSLTPSDASALPLSLLPDSSDVHVKVGDTVYITYTNPDTSAVTHTSSTITAVNLGTVYSSSTAANVGKQHLVDFTIADAIPTFVSSSAVSLTIQVQRAYSYLNVPITYTYSSTVHQNFDTITTAITNTAYSYTDFVYTTDIDDNEYIWLLQSAAAAYASAPVVNPTTYKIFSGSFYVAYQALRQDKYSTVLTIADTTDLAGQLVEATDLNPLGLGVELALANSGGAPIMALSLQKVGGYWPGAVTPAGYPGDVQYDWLGALERLENQRGAYALTPLTQDLSIIDEFGVHVVSMSSPKFASWRVAIVNTKIPTELYILTNANTVAPATTATKVTVAGKAYLQDLTENFITSGVTPGDEVVVTQVTTDSNPTSAVTYTVNAVVNNNTLDLVGFPAHPISDASQITYYVERVLTNSQQATEVASTSSTLGTSYGAGRVWHIQPDQIGVTVNGATKYLPGYYLAAALAGMVAGFPVQQGFTNIAVAGIEDLRDSNFYFRRTDLDTMAAAGTCLFVQDIQGGIPYCRHELTTDMSTLQYREMMLVKNWDFLAYYFYNIAKPFIGSWNITPDTLSNIKQSLIAGCQQLMNQKLPRIGAPLLSYTEPTVVQDANNKDNVNVNLPIALVTPANYINLYLII